MEKSINQLFLENQKSNHRPVSRIRIGDPTTERLRLLVIAASECQGFMMNPEVNRLFRIFYMYFTGNPKFETEFAPWKLDKSLVLCGQYGVGKTMMFKIWHAWIESVCPPDNRPWTFAVTSVEDIINRMEKPDFMDCALLNNLTAIREIPERRPIHILINELGSQYDVKHYGSNVNDMMELFLMKRYEIFQNDHKLTHATMNFGTDKLPEIFKPALIDRFHEMFNMIPVSGESFRK